MRRWLPSESVSPLRVGSTPFKIGYVEQPEIRTGYTALLANNTEISRVLGRICTNFDKLWQRKAFLNWYLAAGMTEEQIMAMRASAGNLWILHRCAEESGAAAVSARSPASLPSVPVASAQRPAAVTLAQPRNSCRTRLPTSPRPHPRRSRPIPCADP